MNSKIRRIILVVMVLLIASLSLPGCKGNTPAVSEGEGTSEESEVQVNGFNGATLKISIWTDGSIPKLGNGDAGDARYYALEQAKEKYDCDVEWVIKPESQYFDGFIQAALSGTTYSNIALQHSNTILSWIKEELVYPTDEFIGEDPENIWNKSYAVYKGQNFGLMPNAENPAPYMLLYYNPRMITELGLEDPQEMALDGTWTWEVFREYCKKATDTAKGTYGVAAFMLPDALRFTNGAYLWTEVDGTYYNAYSHPTTNKNALELLTFIQDMAVKDKSILGDRTGGTTAMELAYYSFIDGNLLFMYAQKGTTLKSQGFTEYAPVTFPIGPSCDTYYNMREGFSIWGIPTTNDYEAKDLAKFWMEAQNTWEPDKGDAHYEANLDDLIDSLYVSTYATREDAEFVYEMGARMEEKASLNNLLALGGTEVNEMYYPVLIGQSTPAAVIEATDSLIQTRIDEVFNSKE